MTSKQRSENQALPQWMRTQMQYRSNHATMEGIYAKCLANPTKKVRGYTLVKITPLIEKWRLMIAALDNNSPEEFKKAQSIVL